MPDQCRKIYFLNKLIFKTSPPLPKKFRSVYHFRGPKIFRTYQNFSKHHTNFPRYHKISHINNTISHKIDRIFPIFFIISQYCPAVERILPDWLCLPNKLGGLAPPPPPPGTPMLQTILLVNWRATGTQWVNIINNV